MPRRPPLIPIGRVREFQRAFVGPVDSLVTVYREAAAGALEVLSDASASLFARRHAISHLHQYHEILAELHDEAALWISSNLSMAYQAGLSFTDDAINNIRRAGVNVGRPQRAVFAQVHREAAAAVVAEMLRTTDFALAQIGRRVDDLFRRVGVQEVARGVAAGMTRVQVSKEIEERLLAEGKLFFEDRLGRKWDLDRYAEMVARTTTREAATQGTINRLREHGIGLAQVSAHNANDFCLFYENVVVSIGDEPHPVYPPISAIEGGPPFHPRCVHVLTPFVEGLATPEELERGKIDPELLDKSPAELQRRFRGEFPARAQAEGRRIRQAAARRPAARRAAVPVKMPEPLIGQSAERGGGRILLQTHDVKVGKTTVQFTSGVNEKTYKACVQTLEKMPASSLKPIKRIVVDAAPGYGFTAGGRKFTAGGDWTVRTKTIHLYNAREAQTVRQVKVVLSHETGHGVYDAAAAGQRKAFLQAHAKWDGTTDYSKAWNEASETFAEMHRIALRGAGERGDPTWRTIPAQLRDAYEAMT